MPTRTSRSSAKTIIRPMPTGRAAARQALVISSAGVVMKLSSCANSKAGHDDQQQEGQRGAGRDDVEEGPRPAASHADERRHAHVLAAPERDDRAQHGEPEEQDRGQLVRPDERRVEHVARDDAGEQHHDLGRRPAARPGSRRARPRTASTRGSTQARPLGRQASALSRPARS